MPQLPSKDLDYLVILELLDMSYNSYLYHILSLNAYILVMLVLLDMSYSSYIYHILSLNAYILDDLWLAY